MQWVIDLDGVMWRGRRPVPGSVEAVAELVGRGDRVVFCTNNSMESGEARAGRLAEQGVVPGCEVVTSADAVAALVRPGERVAVLGGPGLRAALVRHGALATDVAALAAGDDPAEGEAVDTVVVGLTRELDYRQLDVASRLVRDGARLVASNTDSTYPGADGLHPGCGAIVAAVEAASGARAEVAGKPHPPMVELLRHRLGSPVVVVGDRPDTDGHLAEELGCPFALVLSGVTTRGDLPPAVPTRWVEEDLAAVVAAVDGSTADPGPGR